MCNLRRIVDIAGLAAKRTPAIHNQFGRRPSPLSDGELRALTQAVRGVSARDLAIHKADFVGAARQRGFASIVYVGVANLPTVTMAVFVMPPGAEIPLHDHTHMCVVSHVLWGELEVQSYDVLPSMVGFDRLRAVKRQVDIIEEGGECSLTPVLGNIHSFRAREWTAVFDVLVPPYNAEEDRECRYFMVDGGEWERGKGGEDVVFLQETQCPDTYYTISAEYNGTPLSF